MGRTRGPVRPGPARPPRRPGPRDAAPQLAAAELADDDPRAARRGLRPPTPAAARTEPGRRPQAPKQPGPEPPEGDPLMPRRWLTRQLQQLRLVPALLVPTARAIGWAPPLAAFALSVGLLVLAVRRGASSAEGLVVWLRIMMVAGSLLLRRALRVALLLPATAAWWAAAVWRVRAVHPGVPLPVAALTLEVGALLTITIALAAAGSRLAPERRGGVMAAPALLAVTGAAVLLPARVALYAQPGSPGWAAAHQRWAMLLD